MSTTPPEAASPEELFTEVIQAANSRDLKKFYGCLTNEARKDQIELMLHDLGRGAHVAQDGSDKSAVEISDLLATPETAVAVIGKYRLPRGREIRLEELPVGNFDQFVLDMWQALQSKKKPYIDEDSAMLELMHYGDWACAEVNTVQNRHGDKISYIYFKKVNGKWRVDMGPWWYPFAKEVLTKEQKQRLTN
jgi:hypothetical protein